ncbi:MAG: helix-turn-helix domain-containing protein [Alphaproteobacteria bacterium]|nr:helix-turn-helix domain-containing protein [Alphaproteobacteria bacterium]
MAHPVPHNAGSPVFDTTGQRDPFGYWHDTICNNFTSLSPERQGEGAFFGTIATTQTMGDSTMSAIRSHAQIVRRTPKDISCSPSDTVFVNFQLAGSSTVAQRGIEARVPAGSVVLLDARRPFAMKFNRPFQQACLHLPTRAITAQGQHCADVLGRVLPSGSEKSPALLREMHAMLAGQATADTVRSIVSLLLAGIAETGPSRLADQHLKLIRAFVSRNASDPDLSPQIVADHFRISVRHLHKLFARSDQSFGQYLLAQRLQAAGHLVRTSSIPIAQISASTGFRNQSHFSRAFHARYGTTARQLRHRCKL